MIKPARFIQSVADVLVLNPKNREGDKMFVCPDCKTSLDGLFCSVCQRQFVEVNQIPVLLSRDQRYDQARKIGGIYDDVYKNRSKVWEDQGRTPEFISYFADLAAGLSTAKVLEIGCGEGFLLSSIRANEIAAIDLSSEALRKARERVSVVCCVALAERLPFADQSFHLVLAVGVMEHFLNDRDATTEISRVLKPGGHYLTLIHVHTSIAESIGQKVREYMYPHPQPIAFAKWIAKKVVRPISQPIQRRYTRQTAQACLEDCGLVVEEIISTSTHSDVPLIGSHVVAFVARKP
jgi:ubiquinone/menaquinone biosynthesis C-methylase UbiE